jgi:hypothetical protein
MPIQSPIHSFVDFENRITNFALPSYKAQMAFQFLFSSDMNVPRAGNVEVYVGDELQTATLFQLTATVTDYCFWGKIAGLDFDADLPFFVYEGEIIPEGTYTTLQELFDALAGVGFNTTDDTTFLQCCSENLQDYTIATDKGDITIAFYRGLEYVEITNDQETDFNSAGVAVEDCYSLAILIPGIDDPIFSNIFRRKNNTTWLTFVSYGNNEDVYDFHYPNNAVLNKNWLPLYQRKPKYPETRKVYIKSDKSYKTLSASIEKEYENLVEFMPDEFHDRMVVALSHDNIHFASSKIDADVFKKGDYDIDWQENDTLESAQAIFAINIQFEGRNSNCEQRPACVALPEPAACIDVAFEEVSLPDAVVGEAYSVTIALTGSGPFTLTDVTKPAWVTIDIVGADIHITGIPDPGDEGTGVEISFTVNNCGEATPSLSDTIDVINGTHWLDAGEEEVEDTDNQDYENIQIRGVAGEDVTVTVTNYVNGRGGTITFDGTTVTGISQTFPVTLDGSGLSPVIEVHIDGDPGGPAPSAMLAQFTITSATGGTIGSPDVYQISKAFS